MEIVLGSHAIGDKHNRLTLVGKPFRVKGDWLGVFRCDCGKVVVSLLNNVTKSSTKSCGCWRGRERSRWKDFKPGRTFGWLTITGQPFRCYGRKRLKLWFIVVRCDCGNVSIENANVVANGERTSCGCKKGWASKTHGKSKTRLYRNWRGMIERCTYENHKTYERYGGRGITVCDEWLSFEVFEKWALTNGYHIGFEIDRINNDKGYSPENCRVTTHEVNCNNTRRCVLIEAFGEWKTVSQWARDKRCSVSNHTIARRLAEGATPEMAITDPPKTRIPPCSTAKNKLNV